MVTLTYLDRPLRTLSFPDRQGRVPHCFLPRLGLYDGVRSELQVPAEHEPSYRVDQGLPGGRRPWHGWPVLLVVPGRRDRSTPLHTLQNTRRRLLEHLQVSTLLRPKYLSVMYVPY